MRSEEADRLYLAAVELAPNDPYILYQAALYHYNPAVTALRRDPTQARYLAGRAVGLLSKALEINKPCCPELRSNIASLHADAVKLTRS